jgi:hypothetical protein
MADIGEPPPGSMTAVLLDITSVGEKISGDDNILAGLGCDGDGTKVEGVSCFTAGDQLTATHRHRHSELTHPERSRRQP